MAYTADDIILWGKISQPLAAIGNSKQVATNGESADKDHDVKLYLVRKTVEWYNNQTTQDADILYTIANYLFALEGVWGIEAQFVNTGSGGQVVPVTPSSTSRPRQINWTVSSISSGLAPLANGESSVYLNGLNGMPNFIGYDLLVDKNGQPMTQIITAPIYYTWSYVTGLLQFNQAVITGDELQITPV